MPRYIDANKLIELATHEGAYGYVDVHDILDTPAADVAEVRRGRWVDNNFCSECGTGKPLLCVIRGNEIIYQYDGEMNFCPNCGSDNREEKTDG